MARYGVCVWTHTTIQIASPVCDLATFPALGSAPAATTASLCERSVWHCGSLALPNMAARHPAQRHPLEYDADGRSPTPHLHDTTTAHVSGGNSNSVSSADDARGDNTRSASLNPTRATSPQQPRLTPGAYRRPSPPYVRNGLLHRDYVSDDEDMPSNAAPTRRSPTTSGVHRSPSDDGRGEQRGGSPAPTRSATRPQVRAPVFTSARVPF